MIDIAVVIDVASRSHRHEQSKVAPIHLCGLKDQLSALFRAHGFYRPEIVTKVLTYVGFDLPAAEAAALLCARSSYQDWPYTRAP